MHFPPVAVHLFSQTDARPKGEAADEVRVMHTPLMMWRVMAAIKLAMIHNLLHRTRQSRAMRQHLGQRARGDVASLLTGVGIWSYRRWL